MSPALASYPTSSPSSSWSFSLPFPTSNSTRHSFSPLSSSSLDLFKPTHNPVSSSSSSLSNCSLRDGLPTPPAEMNGVAYNSQLVPSSSSSSTYPTKSYHHYSSAAHQYSSNQYAKAASNRAPLANTVSNGAQPSYLPSLATNKQTAQSVDGSVDKNANPSSRTNEKESTPSYSQVPLSIRKTGGNLAEFAAQIACLFWFEKTSKLQMIEEMNTPRYAMVPEALPTAGFQKWLTAVLSTTQVSQNVVLLALLFIYRLKKFNSAVRGKKGSEFRLMTIALMMGNKFLDDNTYTNKTWAEVSQISVQEIHIMEVEFLSNVRYNLYVSKEEWTLWHSKLSRFADFFEKAAVMSPEMEYPPAPNSAQISPIDGRRYNIPASPASKLPSPPLTQSLPAHPLPLQLQPQPQSQLPSYLQLIPTWNPPVSATTTTTPHRLNTGNAGLPRKRSRDDESEDTPSKRMAVSNYSVPFMSGIPPVSTSVLPPVLGVVNGTNSNSNSNMPLAVPSLAVPVPRLSQPATYQPVSTGLMHPALPAATMPQQLPLPHVRAMSTVFNPSTTWSQSIPSAAAVASSASNPLAMYNSSSTVALPDPSRRQSPFNAAVSSSAAVAAADAASPSSSAAFHVHTPQTHLSPSFFLVNRNSPYRPVRAVNTLLFPPPSASLHQPRHLSLDQMHYQPLGKSLTERRTGVLPYLHHDGLPQGVVPQPPNFLPSQY